MDEEVVEICFVFPRKKKNQHKPNQPNKTGFFVLSDRFALPDTIMKANLKTFFDRN